MKCWVHIGLGILLGMPLTQDGFAADVKVATTTFITKPSSTFEITSALSQPNGTYLLSGRNDKKRLWIMKLSSDSKPLWQYTVSDGWRDSSVNFLFGGADDSYWAVVSQRTRDITGDLRDKPGDWVTTTTAATQYFVSQFTDSGRPEQLVPISPTGEQRFLSCAAHIDSGFIVAGAIPSGPDSWSPIVPWIEKLDSSGRRVWDHSFPMDQGQMMEVRPSPKYCRGLLVSQDGTITWAMSVQMTAPARTLEESTRNQEKATGNDLSMVLVQLDRDGKELGRARHASASDGVLLEARSGVLLIDHFYPAGMSKIRNLFDVGQNILGFASLMTANDASGTTLTTYGDGLQEKAKRSFSGGALSNLINAASQTPEGGFLLAGCVRDGANNFVVYISPSGSASRPLNINPKGVQQCSLYQFGPGQHPQEVTLLVANEVAGNRLLTLRYSD